MCCSWPIIMKAHVRFRSQYWACTLESFELEWEMHLHLGIMAVLFNDNDIDVHYGEI